MRAGVRLLFVSVLGVSAGPVAGAEIQAYAGVAAGIAFGGGGFACATGGPTIGNGWFAGIALPTEGFAGCNLAGGIQNQTAGSGTLTSFQDVTGPAAAGQFTGSAEATASFGRLGVLAEGTKQGATSGFHYDGAAAFARFADSLTIAHASVPTGTAGGVSFTFTVDGSMGGVSNAPYTQQADTRLGVRINNTFIWDVFRATVINDTIPYVRGGSVGLPGDFTIVPGSLSGEATLTTTAAFAFQWGVPFTLEVALMNSLRPCCYGTSLFSDFLHTSVLSGITAYGPAGAVPGFTVVSASGTAYGPDGVGPVPLPAAGWLLLAALGLLSGLRARHR